MTRRIWIFGLLAVIAAAAASFSWTLTQPAHSLGDPSDEDQVVLGGALYAVNCARCHGEDLGGELGWVQEEAGLSDEEVGDIAEQLGDVAPAHDEGGSTARLSDEVLFRIIDEGPAKALDKPDSRMSGFHDRLQESEIWAIIAFMKSHWSETATAGAGSN